ncbi:hypothetical protein niasHS_007406 [Heterodera schachtii]|uniref:G-protein coupled receptors family 1 profile domain-containing protein n=1 Tax=Heterodera schachtii TaxID=97005 RepID=A0ABD2JXH8_HETSC
MSPWVVPMPPDSSPPPLLLPPVHSLFLSVLSVFLFALLISLAFSGNSLVIAAIFYDRKLRRQPENLFLVSLAVSDLLVSASVMVFAAANDLLGHWPFGALFCQFWICVDITCCTASILNLCAIALDRFVHISRPMRYARFINRRAICWAICAIWVLSAFVGTAQIAFGAVNNGEHGEKQQQKEGEIGRRSQCQLSLSPSYAVFSSLLSFFLPATLMLFLYSKLYLYARKHARSIQAQLKQATSLLILQLASDRIRQVVVRPSSELLPPSTRTSLHCAASSAPSAETAPTSAPVANGTTVNQNGWQSVVNVAAKREADSATVDATLRQGTPILSATLRTPGARRTGEAVAKEWNGSDGKKQSTGTNNNCEPPATFSPISSPLRSGGGRSLSSDQKARVTLGVIMGTFLFCWTPFFVVNVWRSFQPQLFTPFLFQAVTWLGYANSSLNPVIYGIFNRDFRRAFSRIMANLLNCLREESFSPKGKWKRVAKYATFGAKRRKREGLKWQQREGLKWQQREGLKWQQREGLKWQQREGLKWQQREGLKWQQREGLKWQQREGLKWQQREGLKWQQREGLKWQQREGLKWQQREGLKWQQREGLKWQQREGLQWQQREGLKWQQREGLKWQQREGLQWQQREGLKWQQREGLKWQQREGLKWQQREGLKWQQREGLKWQQREGLKWQQREGLKWQQREGLQWQQREGLKWQQREGLKWQQWEGLKSAEEMVPCH